MRRTIPCLAAAFGRRTARGDCATTHGVMGGSGEDGAVSTSGETGMRGRRRRRIGGRTHIPRIRVLQLVFVLLAVAYGGRLFQLQILSSTYWRQIAVSQNAERVEIPAPRGGLYDRYGRALALDAEVFRAYLAPRELTDPTRAVATAARILGLSSAERRKLASSEKGWVAIPRRLSSTDRDRLLGAFRRGVHFERIATRSYPGGRIARALLGSVSASGEGASGLELAYDSLLRGTPGAALARRDALGERYWLPDAQLAAPRPGDDVVLTIDAELQRIVEGALERALAETGGSGGDILLLDPRTGELLAVASHRGEGFRRIPAFTDPYEPGSTIKPLLLAALLEEELVWLDDRVDVEGGTLKDGRRVIRDVHPYDTLTVAEVVRYSSNVGATKLARRLAPGVHYRYLRDFGFGVPTGVEYPAESGGTLRKPAQWTSLSQASLAMGYEISLTSVQLAAAFGALANGGVLMTPYLVRQIRNAEGRTVHERPPRPVRRVVSAEVARAVSGVLSSVVEEGTATRAAMTSLRVAGKTGTARLATEGHYRSGRYAASFIGYTPADDPTLVILTKLEDPQGAYYGGAVAAPVSQAALQAALTTQGVVLHHRLAAPPPRLDWGTGQPPAEAGRFVFALDGKTEPWAEPAPLDEAARVLPDLRGLPLRAAVARLHELGLHVELEAAGWVAAQVPAPGARVAPGATILLR